MHDVLPHDTVAAACSLAPHIRAVRDELEAMRRIPPALAEAIARAGFFQLYLPRTMGGPELSRVDDSVMCSKRLRQRSPYRKGKYSTRFAKSSGSPTRARVSKSLMH